MLNLTQSEETALNTLGRMELGSQVPGGMEEATIESAEECPGECIFIEIDE